MAERPEIFKYYSPERVLTKIAFVLGIALFLVIRSVFPEGAEWTVGALVVALAFTFYVIHRLIRRWNL